MCLNVSYAAKTVSGSPMSITTSTHIEQLINICQLGQGTFYQTGGTRILTNVQIPVRRTIRKEQEYVCPVVLHLLPSPCGG